MNRFLLAFVLITLFSGKINAQIPDTSLLYNPDLNAHEQISQAIIQAQAQNKHILIQVGGNWCPWCIKLHQFMQENQRIDSLIKADYILIHVNYSKENKNPETMARLGYPQRFGFPVLVILNANGERLHTQNTVYIEEDELYSEEKILDFLKAWNTRAVDPASYLKK
jgi:thioredoxin-related protein